MDLNGRAGPGAYGFQGIGGTQAPGSGLLQTFTEGSGGVNLHPGSFRDSRLWLQCA